MTEVKVNKKSKINRLFTRIIIYGCIAIFFLMLLFAITLFYKIKQNSFQQEMHVLNKENQAIQIQIDDMVSKSIAAKNYIKIWNEDFTAEERKLDGINLDEIKRQIQKLAENSHIIDVSVNFSPLILIDGSFGKQNINVLTTSLTINFATITDIDFFNFLESLKNQLKCFKIIQEVSLKRVKKVDENFLKILNNGNIPIGVEGSIVMRLYGLENK